MTPKDRKRAQKGRNDQKGRFFAEKGLKRVEKGLKRVEKGPFELFGDFRRQNQGF